MSSKNTDASLTLSPGFQKIFLKVIALSQLISFIYLIPLYVGSDLQFNHSYAWGIVSMNAFPLVLFAIAYLFTSKSARILNRLFIAAITAFSGLTLLMLLQSIKNVSFSFQNMSRNLNEYTPPPAWITSAATDYMMMAVVAILFALLLWKTKFAKG